MTDPCNGELHVILPPPWETFEEPAIIIKSLYPLGRLKELEPVLLYEFK